MNIEDILFTSGGIRVEYDSIVYVEDKSEGTYLHLFGGFTVQLWAKDKKRFIEGHNKWLLRKYNPEEEYVEDINISAGSEKTEIKVTVGAEEGIDAL